MKVRTLQILQSRSDFELSHQRAYDRPPGAARFAVADLSTKSRLVAVRAPLSCKRERLRDFAPDAVHIATEGPLGA